MKKVAAFIKENMSHLLMTAFEMVVGILLLCRPVSFTAGVIIVIGVALLIAGVIRIVHYFKASPVQGARERSLASGLIQGVVGIFCITRYGWFIAAFPVLAVLYGVVMLFSGLFKVQVAVDQWRLKLGNALWEGLSAVMTILFGAIILANPFATAVSLWVFAGITMIVTAVLDVLALVLFGRGKRGKTWN